MLSIEFVELTPICRVANSITIVVNETGVLYQKTEGIDL